jgi:iron-sulfur cluster repair protein YtfE (RIC family)
MDPNPRGGAEMVLMRIGKGPLTDGGVLELLLECHARIRQFCALARTVADAGDAPAAEIGEAALRVHRYFDEALPLHAADEEESILPRLRGREPEVDRELDAMVAEHREHEAAGGALARVVALSGTLAHEPARLPELAGALRAAADELTRHFDGHLEREERVIFPAIRRHVDPALDARLVDEVRARRGVK